MIKERILVVDDNPNNLKLVSDLLEWEGYEIFQATNADQAQVIVEAHSPRLILLDIALPGTDGLTYVRKLRSDPRTKEMIIIALTAFAMPGDEKRVLEAGFDRYVTKPIDTRKFPALVASYFPKSLPTTSDSGLSILVVEDSPSDLKLAQHVLMFDGHHVRCAGAAEQALQAVKQSKPHVILLDLLLPRTHGFAVARMLKGDPETRSIPIVAITAYPEKFTKAEALAAGCDAYLIKPFDTRTLPTQLKTVAQSAAADLLPEEKP